MQTEMITSADGTRLRIGRSGDGDKHILIVPGLAEHLGRYTHVVDALTAGGWQVTVVELRGHGKSEGKRGHVMSWSEYTADVVAAAAAVGGPLVLLGHSMGAGISSLVAGLLPSRIRGVFLIEGLGPLTDDPKNAATRLADSLKQQDKHRRDRRRVFATLEDAASRLELAQQISSEAAAILAARATEAVAGGLRWRADPRLRIASRMRFTEAQVHAFLSAIKAPVRLIQAERGFPFDPPTMEARVAMVPDLTLVNVPGHHHVHLDSPGHVAPSLQELIDTSS